MRPSIESLSRLRLLSVIIIAVAAPLALTPGSARAESSAACEANNCCPGGNQVCFITPFPTPDAYQC